MLPIFVNLFIFSFSIIKFALTDDIVVNSTVIQPAWSSLVFIIPLDFPYNYPRSLCKFHSLHYCLFAFVTPNDGKIF